MRVEVYRNLRTGTWSERRLNTGRVERHPLWVTMSNVTFAVQPAGRDKVRREGRKNVHAFVRGDRATSSPLTIRQYLSPMPMGQTVNDLTHRLRKSGFRKATYNPYENDTFIDVDSGEPVLEAAFAELDTELGVWYK